MKISIEKKNTTFTGTIPKNTNNFKTAYDTYQTDESQRVVTFFDTQKTYVNYYPFGMRMSGAHYTNTDLINKYLYNRKELQDQTNWYSYGFREMDPQLGRWHVVDALSEKYYSGSPYSYAGNDPVSNIDVAGLSYQSFCYEHGYSNGGLSIN